jgi:hypothetical protein
MDIEIRQLPEPMLEFGSGANGWDPKLALASNGPFGTTKTSALQEISCAIVALPDEIPYIQMWMARLHAPLECSEANARRYKPFPGVEQAFRSQISTPASALRPLDRDRYVRALAEGGASGFTALLDLYAEAIESLFAVGGVSCILVAFSSEVAELRVSNSRLSFEERSLLERIATESEDQQLLLFKPTDEEKRLAADLLPQADELLFRNFHRALKARCMARKDAIPLQVVTRQAYISAEAKQSDATRAWNLSTALYYKSGRVPWRAAGLMTATCFLGISFHHLKRRSGDLVYASVAQAFSTDVEPFTLKGASVPYDQVTIDKRPYLKEEQASELVNKVVSRYAEMAGGPPARLVIHKTTRYQPQEIEGFRSTALDRVAACDLVWMGPTGFRVLRRGMQPPKRGTYCRVGGEKSYLFTTGYVEAWGEYPGPHIPAPREVGSVDETDIFERCREILALTKMNWNTAEGMSRFPVTISFARRVGMVMTELDDETPPNPLFRFYI